MDIAFDAILTLLTIVSIHIVLKLLRQTCMKVYLAMDGVTIQYFEDVFEVGKMIYMQSSLISSKYIACNVQYCFITHWLYQDQHCIANVSFNTNIPCLLVILSLQGLMKKCLFAGFWKSFTKDETQSKMCDIKKDSRHRHRVLFKLFLFGFNLLNVDDSLINIRKQWRSNQLSFSNCITNAGGWTLSNTNL